MAFREKNAWIAVVSTLIIWGYYFTTVWAAAAARSLDGGAIFTLFLWCMGITIVVMLGLNLFAAYVARQSFGTPPDERELAIDARANRIGLGLLELLGLGVVISGQFVAGYARDAFPADPAGITALIMANSLLAVLVTSAVAREVVQIVHFRLMD